MQMRTLPAILALAAPLALGACVSDGGGAASGGLAGSNAGSASGGSGSELASRTPATASTVAGAARHLVGKSESDIRSELGTPAFKRTDGPAQVWQYRGTSCLLDVFLYQEGGGFRVKHAELRRRGGTGLSERACMSDAVSNRARS